jgi:hypothetical protein
MLSLDGQRDAIMDFSVGEDEINLIWIDANTIAGGDQPFTLVDYFSRTPGELIITGEIVAGFTVQGDTDGDGLANFKIDVHSTHALSASDFWL